jgi:hypothetical protein
LLLRVVVAQARSVRAAVAQWWLGMSSWAVSMLHFYGILKPNPDAKQVRQLQ